MNYLLDTHIFIWASTDSLRLGKKVKTLMGDPKNELFLSAVSLWEMSFLMETKPKDLKINKPLVAFIEDVLRQLRVQILDITPAHAQRHYEIQPVPDHHDLFDRMIIAQGASTGLPVVSDDGKFPRYPMIQVIANG
jgi:PIN domain nuclease of toxin-antitoxin system